MEEIERKYPKLYKMNPKLYDFTHNLYFDPYVIGKNILFLLSNFGSVNWNARNVCGVDCSEFVSEYLAELKSMDKIAEELKKFNYPVNYALFDKSGLALYALIRSKKPRLVLETGVANGFSTHLVLAALNRNKKGSLVSIEIQKDVGQLLGNMDKSRWTLVVGKPKTTLLRTLKKIGKVDVFLHDSFHSYENMLFEFNAVYEKASDDFVVLSDDASSNGAFLEFAKKLNAKPIIIPTFYRSFGILHLSKK
jgi:predicted O-methyltransferase YrrM